MRTFVPLLRSAVQVARHMLGDRRGATVVEYALIIALIVLGMFAGLSSLGGGATAMWGNIATRSVNLM
jgi:pilus assembly protein Flp/PilA